MSIKELSPELQKKLWEEAEKNTKPNKLGQATISKDDEDFDDDVWEELIEE